MERPEVRTGTRLALPFALAVGAFGVSFGVLARAAGIGPLAATVMSGTTFAGSSQFAAVGTIEAGGAVASAIAAALLLNARYLAMGFTVAPALGGSRLRRFVTTQLMVDESWAIAHLGEGRYDRHRLIGAGFLLYVAWVAGTLIGSLGADLVGDPEAFGLDAAFPALFLALMWPQLKAREPLVVAIGGGAIALALIPWTPPGVPIVAAAAACLVGLRRR
ncbi:MAG: AzlC family ABC transporter permease [Actinomycetota bacterium]